MDAHAPGTRRRRLRCSAPGSAAAAQLGRVQLLQKLMCNWHQNWVNQEKRRAPFSRRARICLRRTPWLSVRAQRIREENERNERRISLAICWCCCCLTSLSAGRDVLLYASGGRSREPTTQCGIVWLDQTVLSLSPHSGLSFSIKSKLNSAFNIFFLVCLDF